MAESQGDTFKVGFALSGAISAGAYTAGVIDYFFQALNAWENVRGEDGVPEHRVDLQVITGASAGAITGALGVVAVARGIRPQKLTDEEKHNTYPIPAGTPTQDLRCVLPSLYETWVTRPRAVDPAGGIDFLSTEDLDSDKDIPVVSALNAMLLDDIKHQALLPPDAAAVPQAQPPYPYIAANLHVYITVSNLRGIPYTVSFGNSTYGMQTHGDRVHYDIGGLGTGINAENEWLAKDSSQALQIDTLPTHGQALPPEWDRYGTAALASSAFPVGLAPRQLGVPIADYERRAYPIERGGATLKPNFPPAWRSTLGPDGHYVFLNVDGGVVNNNPFDFAQYALMGDCRAEKTSADDADRAVLMVSPFPEPPAFLPDGQPATELVAVLRALFPALIDQARFKTSELVPAMDPDDHSRFLIAPDRNVDGVEQRYTIACGLLGGFGGFLDEKFRAHDFQLGRRNCQKFLSSIFGLAADHSIVEGLKDRDRYRLEGNSARYAIVPRLGDALPEVPLPRWPRMFQTDFDLLIQRAKGRLSNLAPRFIQAQTSSRFFRALGRIGLFLGQGRVLEYVRLVILSDLVRRDQIEGWELPAISRQSVDDVRLVLAELANPAYSLRTQAGITRTTHLPREVVLDILAQLRRVGSEKPFLVWQGTVSGQEVFTLASRKPGWIRSLPVIGEVGNLLESPTID
jgi:Patatin-like phospholipase